MSKTKALTTIDQRDVDQVVRTIAGPTTLNEVAQEIHAHLMLRMVGHCKFAIDLIANRMAEEFSK